MNAAAAPGHPRRAAFAARAAKFLVAVVGVAAQALSAGLVPARWQGWVALAIAAATAVGVYHVPNQVTPTTVVGPTGDAATI